MICDLEHDWNGLAVSPKTFKKQMIYLKKHFEILRADDDFENCKNNAVVVTFDDGYEDNYINALPILEDLEIPATFFICTGNIDEIKEMWCNELVWLIFEGNYFESKFISKSTSFQFEYETKTLYQRVELYRILRTILCSLSYEDKERVMEEIRTWSHAFNRKKRNTHKMISTEQLKQLAKSNYALIGAHTISHPSLSSLKYEEQFNEIYGSKNRLENIIQKKVKLFSYPFGTRSDYDDNTIEILRKLGFERAMTTEAYFVENSEVDLYRIPRICIKECNIELFSKGIATYFEADSKNNEAPFHYSVKYIGRMEEDQDLFKPYIDIVIWGAGGKCDEILNKLNDWNLVSKVKCIYDTSKEKIKSFKREICVLDLKEYKANENEILIVAISQIGKALDQIEYYHLNNIHYYV